MANLNSMNMTHSHSRASSANSRTRKVSSIKDMPHISEENFNQESWRRKISYKEGSDRVKQSSPDPMQLTTKYCIHCNLGPSPHFCRTRVTHCIDAVFDERLSALKVYNPRDNSRVAASLCVQLSDEIRERVKRIGMERWRVVVKVMLFTDDQQGIQVASGFVWDSESDNHVTTSFRGKDFYALAIVFGVFKE